MALPMTWPRATEGVPVAPLPPPRDPSRLELVYRHEAPLQRGTRPRQRRGYATHVLIQVVLCAATLVVPIGAVAQPASDPPAAAMDVAPPADAPGADAGPMQEILFQLVTPSKIAVTSATIEVERLVERSSIEMTDDGSIPEDIGYDGVFVGRHTAPFSLFLGAELLVSVRGREPVSVYRGILRTSDEQSETIGWQLSETEGDYQALRTAVSFPGRGAVLVEGRARLTLFGWGVFVVCLVGVVLWSARKGE